MVVKTDSGRLQEHPIVDFKRGKEVTIYFNGQPVKAYEGEIVAAALYAAGVRVFQSFFQMAPPSRLFLRNRQMLCMHDGGRWDTERQNV